MLDFLRSNLAWMLMAMALSSTLWATVGNQQNPDVASFVSGVPIELGDKPGALVVTSPISAVNVDVRAPMDTVAKLYPGLFRARIDLSGAAPGVQEYRVRVDSTDRRIRVDNVTPDKVTVRLEAIKKKDVPVRLTLADSPAFGYAVKSTKVTPDQITVTGPESAVDQVVAANLEVHVANAHASISEPKRPVPEDMSGQPVKDVTTVPESVLVEVPIDQQLTYKALPVVPQLAGSVGLGYQVVGMMVDPTILTVFGDPNTLQDTPFLSTQAIDISGASADKVASTHVVLPAGVSAVRSQPVTVRIYVSPVEASKVVRVVPQMKGLSDKLRADLNPNAVDVTVSGPMPLLATLRPQDLQVGLDLTGVTNNQSITVTASVPAPLRVDDVSPKRVAVAVKPP